MSVSDKLKRLWLNYSLRGGSKPEVSLEEIIEIESEWSTSVAKHINKAKPRVEKTRKKAHSQEARRLRNKQRRVDDNKVKEVYQWKRKKKAKKVYKKYTTKKPGLSTSWKVYCERYKLKEDDVQPKWKKYEDYCKSRQFIAWKTLVLNKYKGKCQHCNKPASTAHHIRYRRWGFELVSDGLALCTICHHNIHKELH